MLLEDVGDDEATNRVCGCGKGQNWTGLMLIGSDIQGDGSAEEFGRQTFVNAGFYVIRDS